ncbi:MAG: DUF3520 domain-containing protein [Deltaproteobacteria bacterium]|nr:DUF3520 domain-containing protein [Deltaproteobacteria bacterium]
MFEIEKCTQNNFHLRRTISAAVLVMSTGFIGGCSVETSSLPSNYAQAEPTENPDEELDPDRMIDAELDNLITFSVDVDTASYSSTRATLLEGNLPDPTGIRVEEFLNYFRYDDEGPTADDDVPFAIHTEIAVSPFGEERKHLMRVAVRAKEIPIADRQPANLVFLVDTSGSMYGANKLPLVKRSLRILLDALGDDDTIALVTYAGDSRVILRPTPISQRGNILDAIESLVSGGGTNGAGGITAAYQLAEQTRLEGGINRVILCTDGDFNLGMTGEPLIQLVEEQAQNNIFLTALGFGQQFNDQFLEDLTNRGNGNYAFIDSRGEALRALSENVISTLQVVAKDVKIQIEVDASVVESYRLIGYHNRRLADDDFYDDSVDAGEIGSGHIVVALIELELKDEVFADDSSVALSSALLQTPFSTVNVAFKEPEGDVSSYTEKIVLFDEVVRGENGTSESFRLSATVAEFGEHLAQSTQATHSLSDVLTTMDALDSTATEVAELGTLIRMAQSLE